MTRRESVIAVLRGGKPPVIPSFGECPMDATVLAGLIPPGSGDAADDAMAYTDFFDNCVANVHLGVSQTTLSRDKNHHMYEYETGAVWTERYTPVFCREATRYPVNSPEEAFTFTMPVFDDGKRFDRPFLTRTTKKLKDNGYFVQGNITGAWSSSYYYITRFENMLEWMLSEPEAAAHIMKEASDFSIKSAEVMLECGVDCVFTFSDLGTSISTLFSKEAFRTYVCPWLEAICRLCHNYGAFFHLHSHGHIETFMDDIVESGVDLINPVGPSDNNDLAMFKEKWGDKISFMGGISTTIAQMNEDEMRRHVAGVITVGRKGGRFFPRTESGIPLMPVEKTLLYLDILKEERMKGYA